MKIVFKKMKLILAIIRNYKTKEVLMYKKHVN